MSATIAALLVGTAAVGGFGLYAGSSSSTTIPTKEEALEEVAKVVEQEEEPSQPIPEPESITPPPTPVPEPVPELSAKALPTEETKEEVAEAVPETTNMEGGSKQDGGFGKPTWAPLNSGDSLQSAMGLTKDQIGSTGSSLIAKWTGAKTAESIQLKLKEIDDQLRVLRAEEFTTKSELDRNIKEMKSDPDNVAAGVAAEAANTLRGRYMRAYNSYLTNKTLFDYNSKLISKIIDEKKDQDTEEKSLKDLYKERFPDKAAEFDDVTKKVGLFDFIKGKTGELPENLKLKKTKSGKDATADSWWSSLNNKTSGRADVDPSKLPKYLSDREKSYTDYSAAEEKMNSYKDKFEELDSSIKELTPKLKNIQKKIKELLDTRELVLVELSNYELPKGLFESFIKQKPIQKPSVLPTGEQRDRIIAQIKDLEQQIKEKKEDIQDFLSASLEPDGTLSEANREVYNKKMGIAGNGVNIANFDNDALSKLTEQRDKLILELEGRSAQQKEQLHIEIKQTKSWKDMIRQLRLKPDQEKRFLEPKLVALYASLETMLTNKDEDKIDDNIESYYKTFTTRKDNWFLTSGLTILIKSISDLDDLLNKSGCKWSKGDGIKLFSTRAKTDITGTPAIIYDDADDGVRLYIEGTILRPILTTSSDKSFEVCDKLRVKITKSQKFTINDDKNVLGDEIQVNVDKEAIITSVGVEFLSGNLYNTWKNSVANNIEAFNILLRKIKEDYPEPPIGLNSLSLVQSKGVIKRKQIQSLEEQLTNVALPFFNGQPNISHPLRNLLNSSFDTIKRVLAYLMTIEIKKNLENAAMTLLSPIPALYNFIMKADWSDTKDIDRTIDLMSKLVEDMASEIGRYKDIPEDEQQRLKGLLRDLKATKTTAQKVTALQEIAKPIYVAVLNDGGDQVRVWIPVDTPAGDAEKEASATGRSVDPGDGNYKQVDCYAKLPPINLESFKSMYDDLASMLGLNYKLADALLPLKRYKQVEKGVYDAEPAQNKIAEIKRPIVGKATEYFNIYIISEDIAEDGYNSRSDARRSNIGLALYLIINLGITTLPEVLITSIPIGFYVGIKSILDTRAAKHAAIIAECEINLPNLMSELYFDLYDLALNTAIQTKVPTVDAGRVRSTYNQPRDPYFLSEYNYTLQEIRNLIGSVEQQAIVNGSILFNEDTSEAKELRLVQYKQLKRLQETLRALSDNEDARSWYKAIGDALTLAGQGLRALGAGVLAAGAGVIASPYFALILTLTYTPQYIKEQIGLYIQLAATLFNFGENFSNWETIKQTATTSFERQEATLQNNAKSLFGRGDNVLTPSEKELVKPGQIDSLEKFNANFNKFTSSVLGKIYTEATEETTKQYNTVSEYLNAFDETFTTKNAIGVLNAVKDSVKAFYGQEVEFNFWPVLRSVDKALGKGEFESKVRTSGIYRLGLNLLYLVHIPFDIAVTTVLTGFVGGIYLGIGIEIALYITLAIPFKLFVTAIPIITKLFADSLTLVQTTLILGKFLTGTIIGVGIALPVSKLMLLILSLGRVGFSLIIRPFLAIFNRLYMTIRIIKGKSKEETLDWYASLKTFKLKNQEGKFSPKTTNVYYKQTTLKDREELSQLVSVWLDDNRTQFLTFKGNYTTDQYDGLRTSIKQRVPKITINGVILNETTSDEVINRYLKEAMPRIKELQELPPVKSVFIKDENFIHQGNNYTVFSIDESDPQGNTMKMTVKDIAGDVYDVIFNPNREVESFAKIELGGSKKQNHLTRRQQWTRSKPSRFKTHRIY